MLADKSIDSIDYVTGIGNAHALPVHSLSMTSIACSAPVLLKQACSILEFLF